MLKRRERISRSLFPEILKSRTFVNSKHLTLRVGLSLGHPKFATSISKKIAKSAVIRNTLRRRIYSSVPTGVTPGLYLFIAKAGSATLRGQILRDEVALLLKPFKRS